jgi:membrane-bound serine protease (ClpP class)
MFAAIPILLLTFYLVAHPAESASQDTDQASSASEPSQLPRAGGAIGWIRIADAIHPVTASHLESSVEWALREGLTCLVVEMDTPGGLDTSTRRMVKAILSSSVPVIVYVSPAGSRAASAGVFIMMAAHVAAMAPETNIGAAHPVSIGGMMPGGEQPDSTMIEKITNDAVAYIQSLAEARGRNVAWVEDAVRKSVSVSASEALELGVIDLIAGSRGELLEAIDGCEVVVAGRTQRLQISHPTVLEREMSLRDKILGHIANPNIAYILLLLGGLGIFFELSHPGTLFPGIVGALCLFLAFFALQMLPVQAAGIALIALAIVLFILEIKVTSYGALTMGGLAALIFGSLMLYDTGGTGVRVDWGVLLPSVLIVGGLFIFGIVMAARAQGRRTVTGREGLIGEVGHAHSDLAPRGKIFIHGEIWDAVSRQRVARGQAVRVVAVEGLILRVEPTPDVLNGDLDAGS